MCRMIKIFYFTCLMCLILSKTSFSYSTSTYYNFTSYSSTGYSEVKDIIRFNNLVKLSNVNVKFIQNKTNYIFQITADANTDISDIYYNYNQDMYASAVSPMLYSTDNFGEGLMVTESGIMKFADFISGDVYTTERVGHPNQSIYYFNSSYKQISKDKITNVVNTCTNNGGNFYMPTSLRNTFAAETYNYANTKYFPSTYHSVGASVVNNSYSFANQSDKKQYFYFNSTITIDKRYIDSYRYVCFGQTFVRSKIININNAEQEIEGISYCTNTIDLKEYTNCNHNFIFEYTDKITHKIYCDKCGLEEIENHNLIYEYDGILNNVCTCSYIDKVKYYFEINDDMTNNCVEVCNTGCDYLKHKYTHKTGYKFKWYEKYVKQMANVDNISIISNALEEVYVGTCSEFDMVASNNSTIYKAKVEPIKYIINYSNENSKKINLEGKIDSQVVDYDTPVKLKDNIYYKGYLFSGWSLDMNTKVAEFEAKQEILNLTTEDMKEYILYPIYKDLNFAITYNSGSGKFYDGTTVKTIEYNYFDNKKLEIPFGSEIDSYFKYYEDENGNKFNSLESIKEFVESIGKEDYKLNLHPVFGLPDYGRPERSADGIIPYANSGGNGGKVDPNDKYIDEPLDMLNIKNDEMSNDETQINDLYEMRKLKKDNRKNIFGMTYSTIENSTATVSNINKIDMIVTDNIANNTLKFIMSVVMSKIGLVMIVLMFLIVFIIYEIFIIKEFIKNK